MRKGGEGKEEGEGGEGGEGDDVSTVTRGSSELAASLTFKSPPQQGQ